MWSPEVTTLPPFAPDTAPSAPLPLFTTWFAEAVAAGQPEPHTMSLATSDAGGLPDVRTVMLHGADADGWAFASGPRRVRPLSRSTGRPARPLDGSTGRRADRPPE